MDLAVQWVQQCQSFIRLYLLSLSYVYVYTVYTTYMYNCFFSLIFYLLVIAFYQILSYQFFLMLLCYTIHFQWDAKFFISLFWVVNLYILHVCPTSLLIRSGRSVSIHTEEMIHRTVFTKTNDILTSKSHTTMQV